ncbi:MAG: class I SAM-dependent methyltransferase [Deltaproteobacteria bacterium]|nr:class I SAM-dependent methyltransferase [Deltaproteobacteria bacterium]MBN2673423.1 class I SAM-dependent methyltransferase [Deltaproteobacteria bacterium]
MERNQEQRLEHIAVTYNTLAGEWARKFANEHDRKPRDREMLQLFASEIGKRGPVWDLGCGPGCTSAYLNQLGVSASGLDISSQLIEEATRAYPHIPFVLGNMLELPFAEDEVAGLVSFYGIVHFTPEEVQQTFDEVFRVLQENGLFLCTYHVGDESLHIEEFLGHPVDIDFHHFTTIFITDCLKKSGFDQIAVVEREPYPELEHPSRRAYAFARKMGG